jgi:hypothetical protein
MQSENQKKESSRLMCLDINDGFRRSRCLSRSSAAQGLPGPRVRTASRLARALEAVSAGLDCGRLLAERVVVEQTGAAVGANALVGGGRGNIGG